MLTKKQLDIKIQVNSLWGGIVMLIPLLVCSVFAGYYGANMFSEKYNAPHWPIVPAEVTSKNVTRVKYKYTPEVEYSYSIQDKHYKSNYVFLDRPRMSKANAQRIIDSYEIGSLIFPHYNPSNHKRSAINPTSGNKLFVFGGISALFFLLWLSGSIYLLHHLRKTMRDIK